MTFKTLSKTNENAAHLTENLLTITEKINDGKGTVGLLLNDAEVARDLKKSCIT
jgi:phospholipid/cholesterol/gamma-HCH transport system substrate-binding protein